MKRFARYNIIINSSQLTKNKLKYKHRFNTPKILDKLLKKQMKSLNNLILSKGVIHFDPKNITNKHNNQSSWKKMALVLFNDDMADYYRWFILKRYNLKLNKPLRGAHISFINDSYRDFIKNGILKTEDEVDKNWKKVKKKWDNKKIEIYLNPDVRSDGTHWWLNVPEEHRIQLYEIRKDAKLNRPFFGLHMSAGFANEKNIEHSKYILRLINKRIIRS